jgi:AraC-like DNA-binding protein
MDLMEHLERLIKQPSLGRLDPADSNLDIQVRIDAAIAQGFDDPGFRIRDVVLAVRLGERRIREALQERTPPTSFRAELHHRRMERARGMVLYPYLIDHVAFLCGYRCASTFAAHFKNETGMTPREWRRLHGGAGRAGGVTGCFVAAAERARARRDGRPEPVMTRRGPAPGTAAVRAHVERHAARRAALNAKIEDASRPELAHSGTRRSARARSDVGPTRMLAAGPNVKSHDAASNDAGAATESRTELTGRITGANR